MKTIKTALAAWLLAFGLNATASINPLELLFDQTGKLAGANKIWIDGNYFDVRFVDGTCAAVFNGCDSPTDFAVMANQAENASQALLDQVLQGELDRVPTRTRGCEFSISCWIVTPEAVSLVSDNILWFEARNGDEIRVFDSVQSVGNAARSALDFSRETAYVWAVWSPSSVSNVPEPGSMALVLMGILTLLQVSGPKR